MPKRNRNAFTGGDTAPVIEDVAVSSDDSVVISLPVRVEAYVTIFGGTASPLGGIGTTGPVADEAEHTSSGDNGAATSGSDAPMPNGGNVVEQDVAESPADRPLGFRERLTAGTSAVSMAIGGAILLGAVGTTLGGPVLAAGGALLGAGIGLATNALARHDVPPKG